MIKKTSHKQDKTKRKIYGPYHELHKFDFDGFRDAEFTADYILENQKIFEQDIRHSFIYQRREFLLNECRFALYLPTENTYRPEITRVYIGFSQWNIPIDLTSGLKTISENELSELISGYRESLLDDFSKDVFTELKCYLSKNREFIVNWSYLNNPDKSLERDPELVPWNRFTGTPEIRMNEERKAECIRIENGRLYTSFTVPVLDETGIYRFNDSLSFTIMKDTGEFLMSPVPERYIENDYLAFRKEVIEYIYEHRDNYIYH